tara:strand:- start:10087 stop:10611 length:525 start_codon:yes stop_codon:yes gene_type:complete
MHRAFKALFDVADGLKGFMGLEYLGASTGAHALMSAASNSRYDFIRNECKHVSGAILQFAEMLAERVLVVHGASVHKLEVGSAFYFFARSERWQEFAEACVVHALPNSALLRLQSVTKEPRVESGGLFLLASSFLERENRNLSRPALISKHPRSSISKRSAPFIKLVKRLLSEA